MITQLDPLARLRKRRRELIALRQRISQELLLVEARISGEAVAAKGAAPIRRSRFIRPPCGTESAYQWHRYQARKNEPGAAWPLPEDDPCGCRAAHRAHRRAADQRRRNEAIYTGQEEAA